MNVQRAPSLVIIPIEELNNLKNIQQEILQQLKELRASSYLEFIGNDKYEYETLLFEPANDILDSAKKFLDFDPYSFYMSVDDIFTKKAEEEVKKQAST